MPTYKLTLPSLDSEDQPLFQISKTSRMSPFWTMTYFTYAGHLIPPNRIEFGKIERLPPEPGQTGAGGTRVVITGKSPEQKAVWKTLGEGNEDMVEWIVLCAALNVLDDDIREAARLAGRPLRPPPSFSRSSSRSRSSSTDPSIRSRQNSDDRIRSSQIVPGRTSLERPLRQQTAPGELESSMTQLTPVRGSSPLSSPTKPPRESSSRNLQPPPNFNPSPFNSVPYALPPLMYSNPPPPPLGYSNQPNAPPMGYSNQPIVYAPPNGYVDQRGDPRIQVFRREPPPEGMTRYVGTTLKDVNLSRSSPRPPAPALTKAR